MSLFSHSAHRNRFSWFYRGQRRKRKSLARTILDALAGGLTISILIIILYFVLSRTMTPTLNLVDTSPPEEVPALTTPQPKDAPTVVVPQRAKKLIAYHNCWRDEAPPAHQGEIPGHVIASLNDGEGNIQSYYSSALVAPALDKVFNNAPNEKLTVYAFCP